jgi:3-hydroxyisobutyrate dehydrogenase
MALKIGFIGTGVMGASMARHLMDAGHRLLVYNRTRNKAEALTEAGASWCASPAEISRSANVVITIVGFPEDVEALYFGRNNLFENPSDNALLIDMTTSSPALARRIAKAAEEHGIYALDAPVSGGDIGAREARLSIMCGGPVEAFEQARPVLSLLGKNITYQGPAGSGQLCKLANQIAIASGMVGVCEAMAFAERANLDPRNVLAAIANGAAGSWSLSNLAPRFLDGDFSPGFYIKHFVKDLRLALKSAKEMELDLPGLNQASKLYKRLSEAGYENEGTQALYRLYQD